jgi:adenosylcobyric acid synthase
MSAKCVMVLGTTSGAGKSWLATALCRYYARQGLKVAPFKAQNMSNNARVVGQGQAYGGPPGHPDPYSGDAGPELADVGDRASFGEIGSAQYFQALAANAVPEVRMNPLLLKPETDTRSQVVLMGQVNAELARMDWRGRSARVWPVIAQALDALIAGNDVVVIEGAGSPAEINLKSSDIVNMRVALHANAACLLVTDIDRGGAFAHLYGTWAMLEGAEQKLIRGFVLNKFRGDAGLLAPGPQILQQLTGVPTVATLPMWRQHGLPEEDGLFDMTPTPGTDVSSLPPQGVQLARGGPSRRSVPTPGAPPVPRPEWAQRNASRAGPLVIAIVAYPHISNLDEFQPLKNIASVHLLWVRRPAQLSGLSSGDWIVLPGSKNTGGDLAWLRTQGLDAAIAGHAARGGSVLGICGGLQMLGEALIDLHGIDGNGPGLGLLGLVTVFAQHKTVRRTQSRFAELSGAWAALSGVAVQGYEIHDGKTALREDMTAGRDAATPVMAADLAWQNAGGNVLGVYLHGMFEDANVISALFGAGAQALDSVFDGLADYIEEHFDAGILNALIK